MNVLLGIADLALVLLLVGLCVAVGQLALSRVDTGAFSPCESFLASLAVGMGVVGTCILGTGLLGLVGDIAFMALSIGLGLLSWRQVVALPAFALRAWRECMSGWSSAELVILVLMGVFLLSHAALPPTDFDSLFYHLAIPELYLREGRIFLPPDHLHAAFVGVVQMLYLPLLIWGGPAAPALLSAVIALALIPLVRLFGARVWDDEVGRLAAILIWAGPILVLVAVTPRVDVTLSWCLLLGHYFLLALLVDKRRSAAFYVSALLLGTAVAVKLSALIYVLALGPLIVWAAWRRSPSPSGALWSLFQYAGLMAVMALPWLLRNWIWLGDPVYPYLTGPATEGWLLQALGGAPPTIQIATPAIRQIRVPFNVVDFFFAPYRLTPEGEGRFYFANPALLILLFGAFDREWRRKLLVGGPALAYVLGLLFLHRRGTNLRYLIPLVFPLVVVAAAILKNLVRRPPRWVVIAILLLPLTVSLLISSITRSAWPYLSGRLSQTEYLKVESNWGIRTYLNRQTPGDSHVLMLFDSRTFGIERSVIPDPGLTNWSRIVSASADGCLPLSSVTHIVVNDGIFGYHLSRGLDPASIHWEAFSAFAERCLRLEHSAPGFRVYRLERGHGGEPGAAVESSSRRIEQYWR